MVDRDRGVPAEVDEFAHTIAGNVFRPARRRLPIDEVLFVIVEGTLVGLLRLVYLPEIDNQTAAVEIRMEGLTSFQKIDPLPEAQNLTIPITAWQGQPLVLEVRSHARGTLSIANVVQEYRK